MTNPLPAGAPPANAPALLDVRAVAALLDCSTRHVYRMADAGRMPKPLKIGSLLRWQRADLDAWLAEGWRPPDDLPATAFVRSVYALSRRCPNGRRHVRRKRAALAGTFTNRADARCRFGSAALCVRTVHELRQWLAAGCPTCERWAEMQDADNRRSLCRVSRTRLVIRVMPRKNRRDARIDVRQKNAGRGAGLWARFGCDLGGLFDPWH